MQRIDTTEYCSWCDGDFERFTQVSEHHIVIRRYVGQHGHLIDIAYHPRCFQHWQLQEKLFNDAR